MPRIEWNKAGERFFEDGLDRGVLYPRLGAGVPWNGLVSVNEASSGDVESLYFDGVKYVDIASSEDFEATIEAFSAPAQFAISDGQKYLSPGLSVTQQPRKPFGFCYRTLVGNDLVGQEFGYKLNIVYNCTASPSGRNNKTLSGTASPDTRTWKIDTVPPPATTFRPSARLIVESNLVTEARMTALESKLYGRDIGPGVSAVVPYLPTVAEVVQILST